MSDYKDYGYQTNNATHIFDYLLPGLLSLIDKDKNHCILDLGCGNGYLVNHLISLGFNAYGTDASVQGINIAKQTNAGRFFIQDLSTGQLPAELQHLHFDTIISTEVIEHLYDPEGFIEFCKRTLKNEGEIILSTPYHGYLKNLTLAVVNKMDSHWDPLWLGGHVKFWSRATLSRLLNKVGFTVIEFKGCGRFPYFWKSMLIKAKLS